MQMDRLRIGRAGAVALAGSILLAGTSLNAVAADYGAAGSLRLQLGGGANQWAYFDPAGLEQFPSQAIAPASGKDAIVKQCQYSTTGPSLALLNAITDVIPASDIVPNSFPIGLGPDSIGVYDNAKGVGCYRMTGAIGEGLSFGFGEAISGDAGWVGPGVVFDRLELDIEVKQDAQFKLTVYRSADKTDGTPYFLRSGASITSDGTEGPSNPDSPIFNCGVASDSGADSGPNDNCRWIIDDIGIGFDLEAIGETGEGSLEGGGDFPNPDENRSIIYLASLSETGNLTCNTPEQGGQPNSDNVTGQVGFGPTALCRVTRIDPSIGLASREFCYKDFQYLLATELTAAACNLDNDGTPDFTNPLAASVEIVFPVEPRRDLEDTYDASTPTPGNRTSVEFALDGGGLSPPFYPQRCEGTVVLDDDGNETILEVFQWINGDLTADASWVHKIDDQTNSTPLDWACILDTNIEYVGSGLQRRSETILFWGDARFSAGLD